MFLQVEPHGWEGLNLVQAAIREAVYATIPRKEGSKPVKMRDLRLDFKPPEPVTSDLATVHSLMMGMGR